MYTNKTKTNQKNKAKKLYLVSSIYIYIYLVWITPFTFILLFSFITSLILSRRILLSLFKWMWLSLTYSLFFRPAIHLFTISVLYFRMYSPSFLFNSSFYLNFFYEILYLSFDLITKSFFLVTITIIGGSFR